MRRIVFAFLVILLIATNAAGQRLSGSLSGTALDPAGAAVANAKVTIANDARGFKLELTADADGSFVAPDLAPGDYKITIQKEGFKTLTTTVTIRVGVTTSISPKLELGAVSTVVTVEASIATVDTAKSTVQGVITGDRIDQLPLNGRNFLDLSQLEPGVQVVDGGNFDPTKNQFVGVSVGGRSGRVTRIQVDGVDISDETVGTTMANISNESVQEFGISQSSLDISTDVTSSGAVNIITRSGTNQIHGSGFGFFRDSAYAADLRLNKTSPTTEKPPFNRKQYGGRLGGPFVKDRWFWNVDYEKNEQAAQQFTNVPEFPQFTGAFGVPLTERLASGRTDFQVTNKLSAFYRFQHDENFGVTGFGGRTLDSFANANNTNFHVVGADWRGTRWTHSWRYSYVNFNNGVIDANAAAGTPLTLDPAGKAILIELTGTVRVGPSRLVPQGTFQDNKQVKYDGSVVFGKHTLRFGSEYNHIAEAGFAKFFASGARIRGNKTGASTLIAAGGPFPGGAANPLNYPAANVRLGNNLGFFSVTSTLGFPFGGFLNHRFGVYAQDTWKAARTLTFNFGMRYGFNTGLSNRSVPRAALISLFNPALGGTPRNDYSNFGPQAGFAWNVAGDNKTVIRGGAGIYYETNIFNSLLFDQPLNLVPGFGLATPTLSSSQPLVRNPATGATLFDFSTGCTGLTGGNCFGATVPLGQVIPFAQQAQTLLQTAYAALAASYPPAGVPVQFNNDLGTDFSGATVVDPNYKTPYGMQFNIGIQRQIRPGLVLSVDYVNNRGVHFNQTRDYNRIGAADTFNLAAAQAVLNPAAAVFAKFDNTRNAAGGTLCSNTATFTTLSAQINCTITGGLASFTGTGTDRGAAITDYSSRLGAGNGLDGFTFGGANRNFRQMLFVSPIGLSRYHGLQVRLSGNVGKWGPFKNVTTNTTYSLSRYKSTGVDQDFLSASAFNDKPTAFYGPAQLDRTHQVGVSFRVELPYGFRVASNSTFKTGFPGSLFLPDPSAGAFNIFMQDYKGDGVTGTQAVPLPGSNRGSFGRDIKEGDIASVIANYNSTMAGTLTPAAQQLVNAGLFTSAQLISLGATLVSVKAPPAGQIGNDSLIDTGVRISWRYRVRERLQIEPSVDIFNLFNVANYVALGTALNGNPGDANGTVHSTNPTRLGLGSGSFAPGIVRAFQFGIRVTY